MTFAGYIFGGIAVTSMIVCIGLIIWLSLPQDPKYHPILARKAARKTEDYFRGDNRKPDIDPYRKHRGKLKKSKWHQIRKARMKEGRI